MAKPETIYGGGSSFSKGYQQSQDEDVVPYKSFPYGGETTGFFDLGRDDSTEQSFDTDLSVMTMDQDTGWAWTWDRTIKALVLSPIVIFTILANLLVIYAFLTRKKVLKMFN